MDLEGCLEVVVLEEHSSGHLVQLRIVWTFR
jgi:hypothetical protein